MQANPLKAQQYQILKAKATRALGTSLLIIPELRVLMLTKRHVGSGNEIGGCSKAEGRACAARETVPLRSIHFYTNL